MPLRRQSEREDIMLTQRRSSLLRRESKINAEGVEPDEVKVWKSLYFEAMLKLKNEQAKKQTPRDSQQFVDTNWLQGELAIAKSDKEQLEFQVAQLKSELLLLKSQMEDNMDDKKLVEPPVRSRSGSEATHVNPTEDFYDSWLQSEFSDTIPPTDIDSLASPYSINVEDLQRRAIEKLETLSISKAAVIRSYEAFEDTCLDILVNILQWKNHPDLKPQKMVIKLEEDSLSIKYEDLETDGYSIISQSVAFLPYFKKLEDNCLNLLVSVIYWKNQEIRQPLTKTVIMEGDISVILNEKESELYQTILSNMDQQSKEELPSNYNDLQEMAIDIIRQKKPSTETFVQEHCSFNDIIVLILSSILQWKEQVDHKSIKLQISIDQSNTFTVNYFDFPERALDVVRRNRNLKNCVNNAEEICLQVILELFKWKKLDDGSKFSQSVIVDGAKCIALTAREDAFYKMYLDRATRASRSSNQSESSEGGDIGITARRNSSNVDISKIQRQALKALENAERSIKPVHKLNLSLEDQCVEILVTLLQWKDKTDGETLQIKFSLVDNSFSTQYVDCPEDSLLYFSEKILSDTSLPNLEDVCLEAVLEIIRWKNECPDTPLQKTVLINGRNAVLLNEREVQMLRYINENTLSIPKLNLTEIQEMAVDIIRQKKPATDSVTITNCTLESISLNILAAVLQWKDQILNNELQISFVVEKNTMDITYTNLPSPSSIHQTKALNNFVLTLEEICLQLIVQVIEWKEEGLLKRNIIINGESGVILDDTALALYYSINVESPQSNATQSTSDRENHKISIDFSDLQIKAISQLRSKDVSMEPVGQGNLSLEEVCLQVLVNILQWKNVKTKDPFQISIVVEGENTQIIEQPLKKSKRVQPMETSEQVAALEMKLKEQKQKAKQERRALEDLLMKQFQRVRELEDDDQEN
ncbi:hypothetical protein HDV04_004809 [Boothiomyces sp. JEL0838]|nr:hypothetical protein HDV04_004809 [Boothiomyces sp. JEL0838]